MVFSVRVSGTLPQRGSLCSFSGETPEIAREDACTPQTLPQTASADNYCDPQNLYLLMLRRLRAFASRDA